MPTERLPDPEGWVGGRPCLSSDHNPPNMMVFPPGIYKHTCSACGHSQEFTVTGVVC